jgi:hypothetical protein
MCLQMVPDHRRSDQIARMHAGGRWHWVRAPLLNGHAAHGRQGAEPLVGCEPSGVAPRRARAGRPARSAGPRLGWPAQHPCGATHKAHAASPRRGGPAIIQSDGFHNKALLCPAMHGSCYEGEGGLSYAARGREHSSRAQDAAAQQPVAQLSKSRFNTAEPHRSQEIALHRCADSIYPSEFEGLCVKGRW